MLKTSVNYVDNINVDMWVKKSGKTYKQKCV